MTIINTKPYSIKGSDLEFFMNRDDHIDKLEKELEALRELENAATDVIKYLNPMFIMTDEVLVKLKKSLEKVNEARQG